MPMRMSKWHEAWLGSGTSLISNANFQCKDVPLWKNRQKSGMFCPPGCIWLQTNLQAIGGNDVNDDPTDWHNIARHKAEFEIACDPLHRMQGDNLEVRNREKQITLNKKRKRKRERGNINHTHNKWSNQMIKHFKKKNILFAIAEDRELTRPSSFSDYILVFSSSSDNI